MYCLDILNRKRLPTLEVTIGALKLGGKAPIRLQSMTTTDTMNTELSVEQSIRMITAGCSHNPKGVVLLLLSFLLLFY